MSEFDEIDALKPGKEKTEKLTAYYEQNIKVDSWLNNSYKNMIINFKDRTEYKKNNLYHRLNGPAIDYNDTTKDIYYYRGKKFDNKEEWQKVTIKELRRIKIKKLNNEQQNITINN